MWKFQPLRHKVTKLHKVKNTDLVISLRLSAFVAIKRH